MTQIRKVFSKNLKRLRKKKGLTQEDLAEVMDVTTRYVQTLEGKNCPNVGIETVFVLSKKLGAKPRDFFED